MRFVAEYGVAGPAGTAIDPRTFEPGATEPTTSEILGTEPLPLALTENIYNRRGQVEEVRHYAVDPNNPDPNNYTSTITYYDHRGNPIEVHSPNSPIRQMVYDAKGRQVVSRTIAADLEVTRTETQYDDNDRPIITTHFERVHDGLSGDLEDNCIRTYTHTWYDDAGRVIATANFGTNEDVFIDGAAPPYELGNCPAEYDPNDVLVGCDGDPFDDDVLCTCYDYDDAGRQSVTIHPDATATRYQYDGLGRLLLTTENADDVNRELVRRTAYLYDGDTGQLVEMAAVLPSHGDIGSYEEINWDASDGSLQITALLYGADVVDSGGEAISANNSWIAEVNYPDRGTGQPDPNQILGFSYFSDGSVASRADARGITFEHQYDELGRRIETAVDDSAWYDDLQDIDPNLVPRYRINRIEYGYAPDGMLELATAWAADHENPGQSMIVAQNQYQYDGFNNLLAEWQQHLGAIDPNSPVVDYAWEFSPGSAANYNRLINITYPRRASDGTQRTIELDYGDGLDDALCRVTQITDLLSGAWTSYAYAGISRRVEMAFGNGYSQSFNVGGSNYDGLDRFGRIADLHFLDAAQQTVHRYEYDYDPAGNRLYASVEQAAMGGTPHENDRSYLYGYDGLRRLISSGLGALNENRDELLTGPNDPIPWTTDWSLDNLGNWSGDPNTSVVETGDYDFDGSPDPNRTIHHAVNSANEIEQHIADIGGGPVMTDFVHDATGSLVFDGQFWYQYDAWNRPIQINDGGTLTADAFSPSGRLDPNEVVAPDPNDPNAPTVWPGELRERFVYDGPGRTVTTTWLPRAPERTLPHGQCTPREGVLMMPSAPRGSPRRRCLWGHLRSMQRKKQDNATRQRR